MPAPPSGTPPKPQPKIPLAVLASAVAAGLMAAAAASYMMRPKPRAPQPAASSADTSLDVQWRSQRKEGNDCIATFEITQGATNGARFVAVVMDSGGKPVASDSTEATNATRGERINPRFRRVNCDKIADWQLQVKTPKAPTK